MIHDYKDLVFFQIGETRSTPWLDAIELWNCDSDIKGYSVDPIDAQSYLLHFQKQETKVLFTKNEGFFNVDSEFVLTKPFVTADISNNVELRQSIKSVDINFVKSWLDKNQKCSIGFGCFPDNDGKTHKDIIQNTVFYTRDPYPGGHIYDITNEKFITNSDQKQVNVINWFYAYKILDIPIYFFFFNESLISFGQVDFESENTYYRHINSHLGSIKNHLLKPLPSKNVYSLEDDWYIVYGNDFTLDLSKNNVFSWLEKFNMNYDLIKIKTDLNLERIEDKIYKFSFKKNQKDSFISIRFNTGNMLDWTLINSQNRLVYNIKIKKYFDEE